VMRISNFETPVVCVRTRRGLCRSVSTRLLSCLAAALALLFGPSVCRAQSVDAEIFGFTKKYCSVCHNAVDREGGLDLMTLQYAPGDPENFVTWVKVHDRVQSGEMPPKQMERPKKADQAEFEKTLAASLTAADKQ